MATELKILYIPSGDEEDPNPKPVTIMGMVDDTMIPRLLELCEEYELEIQ